MEAAEAALNEMERIAAHMRAIIVRMPPHDLLGYIYGQRLTAIGSKDHERAEGDPTEGQKNAINESQFLLEYVHAVLASDESPDDAKFDEAQCIELYELSRILKEQAAYSRPRLPLIPDEACHPFHAKAATDSTAKLPPWQAA